MADALASTEPIVEYEVKVLRCGCGDPDSHSKLDPPQPCPSPRAVEDLGVVATNRTEV